jgi:hypothetical protein
MGSYSLLQIVGSTIIGGLFVLMLFRYNAVVVEKNHRYNTQNIVQKNMIELNKLIRTDLNKIGFCLDKTNSNILNNPFVEATDSSLAFKTDVAVSKFDPFGDGITDIVKYYTGGKVTETPNLKDKYLFRSVNGGTPLELNYGVTKFSFKYYDKDGNLLSTPIADLKKIAIVEYQVTLEDVYGYNYQYNIDSSERLEGNLYFLSMSKTGKISKKNLSSR